MMKITVEMKKLPPILAALFLVIVPASQGKPITSPINEIFQENTANVKTNELDNNASENIGHNNLLSDLARISKDEEANVENRHTIVGTEVSAATVKNSNASSSNNSEDADPNTRTTVTNTPTESPLSSYFTYPSPPSKTKENAINDMSLVRLSEPTHIVSGNSKEEENPFSKLVTSNENAPEDEKSNDAVNKQQEFSPLVSGRTEFIPSENGENKQSTFTGSLPDEPSAGAGGSKPQETKYNNGTRNGQTIQDTSSEAPQDDGVKYGQKSKDVNKGVNDAARDHVVVCAGEKQTISCPADTSLNITSADYGYDSNSGCPVDSGSASCQANGVYPVVRSACQGQASCLLQSDGQEFGGMCPGQNNFLKVGYSCYNEAPSSSSDTTSSSLAPQTSDSSYAYQTSPYIPHPVQSTQSSSYHNNYGYNQPSYSNYGYNQANSHNTAYINDNGPRKTNYPYYGYYGNQDYYNYYNPSSQRRPAQTMRSQARPFSTNYYGYKPRSSPRNPAKRPRPAARPHLPRNNYGSLVNAQYRDYSNRYPQRNYNDFYNNRNYYNPRNNYYYDARNGYYDTRYHDQRYSPYRQSYRPYQYPRNSYLGSCYACQNCQQCSEQAYCQGCPKCKELPCNKRPAKEERYLDPIDSLVEEFGKKTKGMTPMEMSAVVLSPAPKLPEMAHSLPLAPPPKALEEDDDDDNDSDESEFVLSDDESNNHEIENHESTSSEKKTSVSTSKSSVHQSTQKKQPKSKTEKSEKRNKIYHKKQKANRVYNDDDDEDGYDLKVYQNLLKKPKKKKIHHHKKGHFKRRKSRKRLSKRWYNAKESPSEIKRENAVDIGEDRSVESPSYEYDGTLFW